MILSRHWAGVRTLWSRGWVAYALLHTETDFTQRPYLHSSICPKAQNVRTRMLEQHHENPLSYLMQLTQLLSTNKLGSLLIQLRSSPAKTCISDWLHVLRTKLCPVKPNWKFFPDSLRSLQSARLPPVIFHLLSPQIQYRFLHVLPFDLPMPMLIISFQPGLPHGSTMR